MIRTGVVSVLLAFCTACLPLPAREPSYEDDDDEDAEVADDIDDDDPELADDPTRDDDGTLPEQVRLLSLTDPLEETPDGTPPPPSDVDSAIASLKAAKESLSRVNGTKGSRNRTKAGILIDRALSEIRKSIAAQNRRR